MILEYSLVIFLFGIVITAIVALGLYQEREHTNWNEGNLKETDNLTARNAQPVPIGNDQQVRRVS